MTTIPLEPALMRTGPDAAPILCRAVLRHFGRPVARVDSTLRPTRAGVAFEQVAALMALSGLGAVAQPGMTPAHLAELTGRGWPVLCPVRRFDRPHWVAAVGAAAGFVAVLDPALGEVRAVPEADFCRDWKAEAGSVRLPRLGVAVYDPA